MSIQRNIYKRFIPTNCKWCSKVGWEDEMIKCTYGFACSKICHDKYELDLRRFGWGLD